MNLVMDVWHVVSIVNILTGVSCLTIEDTGQGLLRIKRGIIVGSRTIKIMPISDKQVDSRSN